MNTFIKKSFYTSENKWKHARAKPVFCLVRDADDHHVIIHVGNVVLFHR